MKRSEMIVYPSPLLIKIPRAIVVFFCVLLRRKTTAPYGRLRLYVPTAHKIERLVGKTIIHLITDVLLFHASLPVFFTVGER
jgi:hypothetical protein